MLFRREDPWYAKCGWGFMIFMWFVTLAFIGALFVPIGY